MNTQSFTLCALLAVSSVFCGCSNNTAQSKSINDAPPRATRSSTPAPAEETAEPPAPKSVFTVDNKSRDPFYPNAKSEVPVEPGTPTDVTLDIPSILRANFHGIVSSGGKSIAYVNNVMLEEGRTAVIPIRAGGQERNITVRCGEVTKDAVILEIKGHPHPVRLNWGSR